MLPQCYRAAEQGQHEVNGAAEADGIESGNAPDEVFREVHVQKQEISLSLSLARSLSLMFVCVCVCVCIFRELARMIENT